MKIVLDFHNEEEIEKLAKILNNRFEEGSEMFIASVANFILGYKVAMAKAEGVLHGKVEEKENIQS